MTEKKDFFESAMIDFINNKNDYLFEDNENSCSYNDQLYQLSGIHSFNELFASVPPIEVFMDISKNDKKLRFLEDLCIGDVLLGSVYNINEIGLHIQLLAIQVGKIRDISNLKIKAFCSIRDIEKDKKVDDVLSNFAIMDKIRGCVIKIKEEVIILSFLSSSLPPNLSFIKLGIISDDDIPFHYSRTLEWNGQSYGDLLRGAEEFANPSNTNNLAKVFDLNREIQQLSFMQGIREFKFEKNDFADQIRIIQSKRLADKYLDQSKEHVECDRGIEAIQLINKALDIFPQHVEALILRAYIYLKSRSYKRAIEDLEIAYTTDQTKINTKKSLVDAILSYVVSLQKEKKMRETRLYIKKGLSLDPQNKQLIQMRDNTNKRSSSDLSSGNEGNHHRNESFNRSLSLKDHKKRLKLLSDSVNLTIDDVDLSPESKQILKLADSPIRFGPSLPPSNKKRTLSSTSSSTSSSSSSSSSHSVTPDSKSKSSTPYSKGKKSISPRNNKKNNFRYSHKNGKEHNYFNNIDNLQSDDNKSLSYNSTRIKRTSSQEDIGSRSMQRCFKSHDKPKYSRNFSKNYSKDKMDTNSFERNKIMNVLNSPIVKKKESANKNDFDNKVVPSHSSYISKFEKNYTYFPKSDSKYEVQKGFRDMQQSYSYRANNSYSNYSNAKNSYFNKKNSSANRTKLSYKSNSSARNLKKDFDDTSAETLQDMELFLKELKNKKKLNK